MTDMEAEERNKWKCDHKEGKVEDKGIGANRMMEHKGKSQEEEVGKEESREGVSTEEIRKEVS